MATQLPVLFEPGLSGSDHEALRAAVAALERQSFVARLAGLAGGKMGVVGLALSPKLQEAAALAAQKALTAALSVALTSLEDARPGNSTRFHLRLAALTGGVGGAVGLAALPIELPLSTTIMLRSIADIARHEGENLREPATALACLEVFALGAHAAEGNLLEGGYLAVRSILAKSVSDAARFVTVRGVAQESAPAMVRLVAQIAGRFGVVVSQKAAAQAAPLIGALSGAAINVAFTDHFQTLARGHFTMRRLERVYNPVMVRAEYARIAREEGYWEDPSQAA
ncbi:EcsC family protein [Methylocystis sp. WRRC1]|uniref:EcsC family protein n=1 Tax=Methylocystis sp. WRRC1 TaxID=1732014 RepID=UPI001D1335AD|nr:EcsC family protein [Methylocystis sp. WRRC1]MCC3247351.1 EcsC family protein [Methylocystis sp. WRRC1]